MLALTALLLLSCGKSSTPAPATSVTDVIANGVEAEIGDSAERHALLELTRDMDLEIAEFTQRSISLLDELTALDANREATRSDFDKLVERLASDRRETMTRIAKIRIKMREKMSAKQWQAVHAKLNKKG